MYVEDSFKDLDCEVLFGKRITSELLNDDPLVRCLELLGNIDINKLSSVTVQSHIKQKIQKTTENIHFYKFQ